MSSKKRNDIELPEVEATKTENTETPVNKKMIGKVVKCEMLNFRKKPSKDNSAVIKTLKAGDTFEIFEPKSETDLWYKIKVDNVTGFVMKEFVEVVEE